MDKENVKEDEQVEETSQGTEENNTEESSKPQDSQEGQEDVSESEAEKRARKLEEERNNIRDELIAIREERRNLRQQLEELSSNPAQSQNDDGQQDIAKVIEGVLQQKDRERATENRKKAFEKYVREHKEYHPENDSTGLKRERLETEFSRFNLSGVVEAEDFYDYISKADMLIKPREDEKRRSANPYPTDPSSSSSRVPTSESNALSQEEKKVAQKAGWSEEKMKELKEKDPMFYESLLS